MGINHKHNRFWKIFFFLGGGGMLNMIIMANLTKLEAVLDNFQLF